ncbi:7416_t:CDS:2 [Cetraspora pellucida]|uniref:7416_t:CDS:1 n=1 Tax=Cetraspora pellucida TaxID=1433469 RepID=A0A9N9DBF4_9GLOM|nr:7416_t:CDS:2 [Cetraspora pellucida]
MEKWFRLPTIAQPIIFLRNSASGRVSLYRHLSLRKIVSRNNFKQDYGVIQNAILNETTYFKTLGIGDDSKVPTFDIDSGQLRSNYLKLQQLVHPDRYGNKDEATESESLEDPELLMKILDARERLEEAIDEDEAKNIKNESEAKINEIITELSRAFKSNDLVQAKKLTVKLQYWYNIRDAAIGWEQGKPIDIHH